MLQVPGSGQLSSRIWIVGEAPGLPLRILNKIVRVPESGCWIWLGSLANGYGEVWWGQGKVKVHRLMYETLVGEIPNGLELDHLCRVPACCNPYHLEPVTHAVNCQRGIAGNNMITQWKAATHCQRGHPWSKENTYTEPNGKRRCLECKRMRLRNWRALQK